MNILIIEDEPKTSQFLKKGFTENGFSAEIAELGDKGLLRALTGGFDFIILDVMLPRLDGWTVVTELRKKDKDTPVLMLSAKGTAPDRIRGLKLGADDYLVKPFAFSELLERVNAILRRTTISKQDVLRIADLEMDLLQHKVIRSGKNIELTLKEFLLLSLLIRNSGKFLSRFRIAERIWNIQVDSDSNVIEVHIRNLRIKVDGPFEKKLIHTVHGLGYVLEER